MSTGNVPEVQGTGLRQLAGILSIVDLSGNNIATFSSSAVVLGNSTGTQILEIISPFVQIANPSGPIALLTSTTAPVDQGNTQIRLAPDGAFNINSASDAGPAGGGPHLISASRSGTNWPQLVFGDFNSGMTTTIAGGGGIKGEGPTAAAPIDMTPDAGTFTASYTGFNSAVTGGAQWIRIGGLVMLVLQPVSGTSNVNTFTLANLPPAIRTSVAQFTAVSSVCFQDNSVNIAANNVAVASAEVSSSIIFFAKNNSTTQWTASGTKGIAGPLMISYLLS